VEGPIDCKKGHGIHVSVANGGGGEKREDRKPIHKFRCWDLKGQLKGGMFKLSSAGGGALVGV